MKRRDFITLLGGVAAAWPLSARTRQMKIVPRVGILWIAPEPVVAPFHEAFRQELRELGYIEGANIMIEYRLAAWDYGRLPAMAPDLVRLRGRYHRHRHPESRTNCAGRHSDDPNRRGYRRDRSGGSRARHEPWASGRQPHRLYRTWRRA